MNLSSQLGGEDSLVGRLGGSTASNSSWAKVTLSVMIQLVPRVGA